MTSIRRDSMYTYKEQSETTQYSTMFMEKVRSSMKAISSLKAYYKKKHLRIRIEMLET